MPRASSMRAGPLLAGRRTLLARSLLLPLALLAMGSTLRSAAGMWEETAWTRGTWGQWRLPLPPAWAALREGLLSGGVKDAARSAPVSSLAGPYLEPQPVPQAVPGGGDPPVEELLLRKLRDNDPLGPPALVARCHICRKLVQEAWYGLSDWVLRARALPERRHVSAYLKQLCEEGIPPLFLREWIILRSEREEPPGTALLYSLQPRGVQGATLTELRAARQACHSLAQGLVLEAQEPPGGAALASVLLHKLRELRDAAGRELGAAPDPSAPPAPAFDDCRDYHPSCASWARQGECQANERYMMGAHEWPGHCRRSCKACKPPASEGRGALVGLPKKSAVLLHKQRMALLAAATSEACVASGVCAEDGDVQQLVQQLVAGTGKLAPAQPVHNPPPAEAAAGAGGGGSVPRVYDRAVAAVTMVRPLGQALTAAGGARRGGGGQHATPATTAHAHLQQQLGGRCFYVGKGWWSYELCMGSHIAQFHVEGGVVQNTHLLGTFDARATIKRFGGTPPPRAADALLSGMPDAPLPFVGLVFSGGAPCELQDQGHTRAVPRSAELRVVCSPDERWYMVVTEPAACKYVTTLFAPPLCTLPAFDPAAQQLAGGHGGDAAAAADQGGDDDDYVYYDDEDEEEVAGGRDEL